MRERLFVCEDRNLIQNRLDAKNHIVLLLHKKKDVFLQYKTITPGAVACIGMVGKYT